MSIGTADYSSHIFAPEEGHEDLHEVRLDTVVQHLLDSGVRTVLDLGCGNGQLLQRLAPYSQFTELAGLDADPEAVSAARVTLGLSPRTSHDRPIHDRKGMSSIALGPRPGRENRIHVRVGSFAEIDPDLVGFDAAVMLETIEHIEPQRLSRVERAVFSQFRPRLVLITTPNEEYNVMHGMVPGQTRHPDHRFEWNRAKFQQWARGVATRNGYAASFFAIGPSDPILGSSTQMASFTSQLQD